MKKFEELGLSKNLLNIIKEEGFESPSEIQEKAIPLALAGKDIVGGSATGSGKTLAFSASIIENLKPTRKVQALILTPTRELAEQVSVMIRKFSKNTNLNVLAVYGGVNIESQIRKLALTDVVVGTPGRILDHMQRKTLTLKNVKVLVLDEVDRMFDMGFYRDIEKILKDCPKERQTMMFSATISEDINHFISKYTKDATKILVKSYIDSSKLRQIYYDIDSKDKFSLLFHLLKEENADSVMVFCSTRRNTDFIAKNLVLNGINANAIHGGLDQNKRIKVLKEFHEKRTSVLVCTDVAARGLDIKNVSHVYNYDLPATSNEYIHRIGRTARAGEEGEAISLLSNKDYENFKNILKDSSLKISCEKVPRFDFIGTTSESRGRNFSRGDRSGSRREDSGRHQRRGGQRSFSRSRPNSRDKPRRNFRRR